MEKQIMKDIFYVVQEYPTILRDELIDVLNIGFGHDPDDTIKVLDQNGQMQLH